jgi:hypothetical protein
MKTVSLATVKRRALRDRKFLNDLLKNTKKALHKLGWNLAPCDFCWLLEILKCVRRMQNMSSPSLYAMQLKPDPWPKLS